MFIFFPNFFHLTQINLDWAVVLPADGGRSPRVSATVGSVPHLAPCRRQVGVSLLPCVALASALSLSGLRIRPAATELAVRAEATSSKGLGCRQERIAEQRQAALAGRRARHAGKGEEQQRYGLQPREDGRAAPGRACRPCNAPHPRVVCTSYASRSPAACRAPAPCPCRALAVHI